MNTTKLGAHGPRVSAIGLGCMAMSGLYGPADEAEGIATIRAALDAGVTLLDTGDFYGMGHNEILIREALRGMRREDVVLSVKFGALRDPSGGWSGYDCRPQAIKNFLAYSLKRLGVDYVDIYRPARLDKTVPIEETVGTIGEMVKAGYVRHVGLSEVGAETIRKAASVHPISDLQIEYSLVSRGIEKHILPVCRELKIGITAYGVLSRGLISGHWNRQRITGDPRTVRFPRFASPNVEQNLALVESLRAVAEEKGVTVAQLAIAWVAAQGSDIVPLVGPRKRESLSEALGAGAVTLTRADLDRIEAAVPAGAAQGERYAPESLRDLDSERES
ncbi:MAG TPA: aldo/keto reductase [Syntrophorhabdales bacterium]|nr:aldo/keto reductase [Syntrophorhabdales bacterium]